MFTINLYIPLARDKLINQNGSKHKEGLGAGRS